MSYAILIQMYSAEEYFRGFLFFGLSNSEQRLVNFTNSLSHCEHIGVPIDNGKKKRKCPQPPLLFMLLE